MSEEKFSVSNQKQTLALTALVEAILFVSPEPLNANQIGALLDVTPRVVKIAIEELDQLYQDRGIRLQHHNGKVQITSAPEAASLIENMLELENQTSN